MNLLGQHQVKSEDKFLYPVQHPTGSPCQESYLDIVGVNYVDILGDLTLQLKPLHTITICLGSGSLVYCDREAVPHWAICMHMCLH